MPREDAKPGSEIGIEPTPPVASADGDDLALSKEERSLLDHLVLSRASRTPAQLSASCGLSKEQVTSALEGLRTRGLVARHNTLVESYAARFPGTQV